MPQKSHFYFYDNCGKYRPISIILSLLNSQVRSHFVQFNIQISQGSAQQNWGVVEDFILPYSAVYRAASVVCLCVCVCVCKLFLRESLLRRQK